MSRPRGGVCPQGHASDDPDWCDVCGLAMASAAPASTPVPPAPPPASVACAACGADLDGRFCESCGHDSLAPAGPAPVPPAPAVPAAAPPAPAPPEHAGSAPVVPNTPSRTWWAVVRVDRGWFDEVRRQNGVDAATLEFPRYAPARRFPLRAGRWRSAAATRRAAPPRTST